jgi:hypothetical protein
VLEHFSAKDEIEKVVGKAEVQYVSLTTGNPWLLDGRPL